MAKKTYKEEVIEIAKAFCKKYDYEFIFANEDKFGFQTKDGSLWTMNYFELEDILKNKK
ncbi:MAG: hypothetical protein J6T15_03880 [Bacilli bacterium]|nr:hypothetical protein [Bacilli bacterium]